MWVQNLQKKQRVSQAFSTKFRCKTNKISQGGKSIIFLKFWFLGSNLNKSQGVSPFILSNLGSKMNKKSQGVSPAFSTTILIKNCKSQGVIPAFFSNLGSELMKSQWGSQAVLSNLGSNLKKIIRGASQTFGFKLKQKSKASILLNLGSKMMQ